MRILCSDPFALGQGFEEVLAIDIIHKNVLPAVAPVHDVVDGPRILHSHRARHARKITNSPPNGKGQQRTRINLRFDSIFRYWTGVA